MKSVRSLHCFERLGENPFGKTVVVDYASTVPTEIAKENTLIVRLGGSLKRSDQVLPPTYSSIKIYPWGRLNRLHASDLSTLSIDEYDHYGQPVVSENSNDLSPGHLRNV